MTQKIIDVGGQANDGAGDSIRSAFDKVNLNFTELYKIRTPSPDIDSTCTGCMSNIDGGAMWTVYNVEFNIDGGAASTVYNAEFNIDGGGA